MKAGKMKVLGKLIVLATYLFFFGACLFFGYALATRFFPSVLGSAPHANDDGVVPQPFDRGEMVLIPAGDFTMGGDDKRESPRRRVYLDAYRIGKNLVTVRQFRLYCAATGIDFSTFPTPRFGWVFENEPMANVSWQEARDFCKWAGGDLPTEAQWEKAARGTDGLTYPWGNAWDPIRCVHSERSFGDHGQSLPVGEQSGASPYGCLDMAGNVWEWCLDWYADGYSGQPDRNPKGPDSGTARVLRGGSWVFFDPEYFRSSFRYYDVPTNEAFDTGFRLAAPP